MKEMSRKEAAAILARFNYWRRGGDHQHLDSPKQIGIAIDKAIYVLLTDPAEDKKNRPGTTPA